MTREPISRRQLLGGATLLTAGLASAAETPRPEDIIRRLRAPVFPTRDFDITMFGAVGDGVAKCTIAIHKTIEACSSAGGGRVVVPAGRFLTGPIHLESNVNLYLASGATLLFSRDPKD